MPCLHRGEQGVNSTWLPWASQPCARKGRLAGAAWESRNENPERERLVGLQAEVFRSCLRRESRFCTQGSCSTGLLFPMPLPPTRERLKDPTVSPGELMRRCMSGPLVIMLFPCRFVDDNRIPTLVRGAASGGGCAGVGARRLGEFSVPSTQFCSDSNAARKAKVY